MKILNQDLWSAKADLVVVTCNGYVTKDGRLVMGRGAAKEAADRFPKLQSEAGRKLSVRHDAGLIARPYSNIFLYGFLAVPCLTEPRARVVGLLQVKFHFKDKASLALIGYSIVALNLWLQEFDEVKSVAMNFPGIGYGGLERKEVEPLLEDLDDRVIVYVKE